MTRVLFVCLGNICRSPTAEGVLRGLAAEAGLEREIEANSAGTGSWHVGEPPDQRAVDAAARRGIELDGRARQVEPGDFERFDLLVAMDRQNRDALVAMAPAGRGAKVRLLRQLGEGVEADVPDPYFGGPDGFAEALEIIERNCRSLLARLDPGADGDALGDG